MNADELSKLKRIADKKLDDAIEAYQVVMYALPDGDERDLYASKIETLEGVGE